MADALGFDLTDKNDKQKVKSVIDKWLETDVLRLSDAVDQRQGRPIKVVIAGDNCPVTEEEFR